MRLCPHCGTRKSVSLPATQRWGDTSMAQHWKKAGNKENDINHEKQPGRGPNRRQEQEWKELVLACKPAEE